MFDGVGLLGVIETLGTPPQGRKVGLIGAGGAGATIAFALAEAGAESLVITDQDGERAARLAERVGAAGSLKPSAGWIDVRGLDLLINATPAGMAPGDSVPIDIEGLSGRTAVVDIATKASTPLLDKGARRGFPDARRSALVEAQTNAILFIRIRPEETGLSAQKVNAGVV